MAVTLTSSGVTFNDSTTLNSKYDGGFRQNSRTLMFRSAAPTGWSQITTHNDKAFRVVSGTGAGSSGTNSFTSAFATREVSGNAPVTASFNLGNTSLSINTIPSHTHPATGQATPRSRAGGGVTGHMGAATASDAAGSGQAHNHGSNASSTGGSVSANQSFTVQYVNVIICNHS